MNGRAGQLPEGCHRVVTEREFFLEEYQWLRAGHGILVDRKRALERELADMREKVRTARGDVLKNSRRLSGMAYRYRLRDW